MQPDFDRELGLGPSSTARRAQLERQRTRFIKAAQGLFAVGTAGVVVLCVRGLNPPALGIPVFLAVVSVIFAAASAALFALVVQVQLGGADEDVGDDGGGPGGGSKEPPEPTGPVSGLAFDWDRFERDFRRYCDRVPSRA